MPPLMRIVFMIIAFGFTPAARAAAALAPVAPQVEAEAGAPDEDVEDDAEQDRADARIRCSSARRGGGRTPRGSG